VRQRRSWREALTCGFFVSGSSSGEETVSSGGFVAPASRSGDESCVVCSFRRRSVELGRGLSRTLFGGLRTVAIVSRVLSFIVYFSCNRLFVYRVHVIVCRCVCVCMFVILFVISSIPLLVRNLASFIIVVGA
jgi:hypothetical protein